jgi:hypothetical protein
MCIYNEVRKFTSPGFAVFRYMNAATPAMCCLRGSWFLEKRKHGVCPSKNKDICYCGDFEDEYGRWSSAPVPVTSGCALAGTCSNRSPRITQWEYIIQRQSRKEFSKSCTIPYFSPLRQHLVEKRIVKSPKYLDSCYDHLVFVNRIYKLLPASVYLHI